MIPSNNYKASISRTLCVSKKGDWYCGTGLMSPRPAGSGQLGKLAPDPAGLGLVHWFIDLLVHCLIGSLLHCTRACCTGSIHPVSACHKASSHPCAPAIVRGASDELALDGVIGPLNASTTTFTLVDWIFLVPCGSTLTTCVPALKFLNGMATFHCAVLLYRSNVPLFTPSIVTMALP